MCYPTCFDEPGAVGLFGMAYTLEAADVLYGPDLQNQAAGLIGDSLISKAFEDSGPLGATVGLGVQAVFDGWVKDGERAGDVEIKHESS